MGDLANVYDDKARAFYRKHGVGLIDAVGKRMKRRAKCRC
jgi:hypothetical protein